ncbi:hypothetical protein GWI33_000578 [Rhynchophorus ferrugineus]|uniref:Uncharacterized protein n=1 Tax=Rhynchophorus ferrugineus TaxID=354439 RepID=A0A834HL38_RHYFE|nr:hypothetical protein GWI33_000578 [Rhynchophorus ferrugineus]
MNRTCIILLLFGIFSLIQADSWKTLQWFLECCEKAIREGVPAIPVPKHDPFKFKDLSYGRDFTIFSISFALTNNVLRNILKFSWPLLNMTDYTNPERNFIVYDIYWPSFNFTGDYKIEYKTPSSEGKKFNGSYNILLNHINWSGDVDFIQPCQNIKMQVDKFSLKSKVKDVKVKLTGPLGDDIVTLILKKGIYLLFNNIPSFVADLLREKRLNGFWASHPERIDTVFQFCLNNK